MVATGGRTQRVTAAMLAETADLPYFRVDADRRVVEVSSAMERLTGFDAREVLGRSCLTLHRCDDCLAGCGVFDCGVVRSKHLTLYRADGSRLEVAKSGRVLRDEDGRIEGAIEVVRPLEEDAAAEPDDRRRLRTVLERTHYRRSEAARQLGISRTTLWRRMRKHGLASSVSSSSTDGKP